MYPEDEDTTVVLNAANCLPVDMLTSQKICILKSAFQYTKYNMS
jgi:hypothetical protein